ncbi:hypothetical protein DESHY_110555 [Desulforamulus hydrothermalis Lam5 = DSM 18033]|uniref:Uncharacterized protein n=1 Tax=Desulforamulus hydrothermalis Lam5 = DSM 18033 TaxID=1121428 RepID=K8DY19_9FIRM|nr:hypothetical protein DESHY_110555 [Desulforamulus hydrothermalis Lam5 = DSM 18033]
MPAGVPQQRLLNVFDQAEIRGFVSSPAGSKCFDWQHISAGYFKLFVYLKGLIYDAVEQFSMVSFLLPFLFPWDVL